MGTLNNEINPIFQEYINKKTIEIIETKTSITKLLASIFITRCTRCVSFNRATNSPIFRVSKNGFGNCNNELKKLVLIRLLKSLDCCNKKNSLNAAIPTLAKSKTVNNPMPETTYLILFEGKMSSISF